MTDRADAAVIALILPAMLTGSNLHVAGVVSEKIFYNASGPLQAALRSINPNLQPIHVAADRIVCPTKARGVATGFSGGVDSFAIVRRHFLDDPPPGFRLTHLTLHDVYTEKNFVEFDFSRLPKGLQNVRTLAEKWGLPLVTVSSNVGAHYNGWRFEDSHSLRNASAAHVLSEGIGRYIYASGHQIGKQGAQKSGDLARADVVLLPMVSSEAVECFSGDPEFTRVEKTLALTSVPETQDYLQVCAVSWYGNCSACFKCRRTLYTLEMLGKIELYSRVFNIDVYRRDKEEWLANAIKYKDPFILDIQQYAKEHGIEF
jgi:hypothetical protein